MSEIFVSYARSTAKEAQAVAESLRALGYAVWLDDDLPAHRAFNDVIDERLRAARAVVVVWSKDAAASQWVRAEADLARIADKLVQIVIDGTTLPLPFSQVHCVNLSGWSGDTGDARWRRVLASIDDLVGQSAPAAPAAPVAFTRPLLAVLPFDNLSGDPELLYFTDGVSEEILQTVARGAELKVIGRGSSFQFRGADKAAAHVARTLKATHVLDGSVRRSGAKVRIAANLIECESETTLWSDRFDRELSDVFALQDEIAGAIAAALKVAFAPVAEPQSVDPAAYHLYLKARELRNRGLLSPATVVAVIELLEEATRLAPKFARAWEFLATMQAEHLRFDETRKPPGIGRAEVVRGAETALRLDPRLGAAYQALGQLEPFGRFAEREALQMKALAAAPNDPTVLTNASLFFAEVGRMNDAVEYARQAYALDPMYPWAASWYAVTLDFAGQEQACRDLWRSYRDRWPDNELIAWGAICAATDFCEWSQFDALVAEAREKGFDSPTVRGAVSWGGMVRSPSAEVVERHLKRARDRLARTGVLPIYDFTKTYALGMKNEAFELIEQASFSYMFDPEQGSPNGAEGPAMMFRTHGDAMMHDIRFVGLCAKLGLCDYWVQTNGWPDCAELVASSYDFKAEARRLAS